MNTVKNTMLQHALEKCWATTPPARPNFTQISEEFDVKRTTLRNHYNRSQLENPVAPDGRRHLSQTQEDVLLEQIDFLALRKIFYTPAVLRNMAAEITGQIPSSSWSRRFINRHHDRVRCLIVQGMEATRHTAEYKPTFDAYFDLLSLYSH